MPVLLSVQQAPTLAQLLDYLHQQGIQASLADATAAQTKIQGIGSLAHAGPTEISFLANEQLHAQLDQCQAAAVIMSPAMYAKHSAASYAVVVHEQPYLLYALLAQWFDQQRLDGLPTGIHPSAVIDPTARIDEQVHIGPQCIIEAGVHIQRGSRLGPACIIGAHSRLGKNSLLHARVTLYHQTTVGDRAILHSGCVLGADGFGFAPHPQQGWAKIAQLGTVELGHDVEVGANTTIDRGALDRTYIGHGVKLDNQIMVGHNVHIGDHTAIAACVGIAGSTHIGAHCIIGGAAMISGHLHIADKANVSGGTAITSSINQAGRYSGVYPYAEHKDWQRNAAVISQLSSLRKRLRRLERLVNTTETE